MKRGLVAVVGAEGGDSCWGRVNQEGDRCTRSTYFVPAVSLSRSRN